MSIDIKKVQKKLESIYKDHDPSKDNDKQLLKNDRASLQYQDPAFRADWEAKDKKARVKKEANPVFRAARVERGKKIVKDPKRNQKIANTVSSQWADPAYKDWRTEIQQEVAKTEEFKQAHADGMKKREENGWEEKNKEGAKKKCKPIQTPLGRFESKGDAVKAMTAAGEGNAGGKLSVWLKTKPTEYYYIKT
jgi:hypothetical protein